MNWGNWIIVSFIAFALFVAALVYVCVRQDINLVTKNYYQEELAYQLQIERIENAKALEVLPSITVTQEVLEIKYQDLPKVTSGSVHLFRPSDSDLDQLISLKRTESTSQQFRISPLVKGLYKARFTWKMNDKEYYFEKIVIL